MSDVNVYLGRQRGGAPKQKSNLEALQCLFKMQSVVHDEECMACAERALLVTIKLTLTIPPIPWNVPRVYKNGRLE